MPECAGDEPIQAKQHSSQTKLVFLTELPRAVLSGLKQPREARLCLKCGLQGLGDFDRQDVISSARIQSLAAHHSNNPAQATGAPLALPQSFQLFEQEHSELLSQIAEQCVKKKHHNRHHSVLSSHTSQCFTVFPSYSDQPKNDTR